MKPAHLPLMRQEVCWALGIQREEYGSVLQGLIGKRSQQSEDKATSAAREGCPEGWWGTWEVGVQGTPWRR